MGLDFILMDTYRDDWMDNGEQRLGDRWLFQSGNDLSNTNEEGASGGTAQGLLK